MNTNKRAMRRYRHQLQRARWELGRRNLGDALDARKILDNMWRARDLTPGERAAVERWEEEVAWEYERWCRHSQAEENRNMMD